MPHVRLGGGVVCRDEHACNGLKPLGALQRQQLAAAPGAVAGSSDRCAIRHSVQLPTNPCAHQGAQLGRACGRLQPAAASHLSCAARSPPEDGHVAQLAAQCEQDSRQRGWHAKAVERERCAAVALQRNAARQPRPSHACNQRACCRRGSRAAAAARSRSRRCCMKRLQVHHVMQGCRRVHFRFESCRWEEGQRAPRRLVQPEAARQRGCGQWTQQPSFRASCRKLPNNTARLFRLSQQITAARGMHPAGSKAGTTLRL